MLGRGKKKTKTILVPDGETITIKKQPKCSIKNCDKDGTKRMCTLPMCDDHHKQASD